MDDYISIASLNDFIFCPYSIYLHNVYMEEDETLYKATPQIRGTIAHEGIDKKTGSTKKTDIMSLPVYSDSLRLKGKIDLYRKDKKQLIERKIISVPLKWDTNDELIKYKKAIFENAIHRDKDIVYF